MRPPPPPQIALPYSMRVISACTAGSRNCVLNTNPLTLHFHSSNIRHCLHPSSLANMGRNFYLYRFQLHLASIFTVHNIVKPIVHEISNKRVFSVCYCLFEEYLFADIHKMFDTCTLVHTKCTIYM